MPPIAGTHFQQRVPDAQHGRRLFTELAPAPIVLDHGLHDAALVARAIAGVLLRTCMYVCVCVHRI